MSDCYMWPGAKPGRYGYVSFRGKQMGIHRWIASFMVGRELTRKEVVCHRCDTPGCFNPDHLFIGTHQDNTLDMYRKGRHSKNGDTCRRGHPYDEKNTYWKRGTQRVCRACVNLSAAKARARKNGEK